VVFALIVQLLIAGLAGFLVVGLVSVYETSADETTIAVTGDSTELVHDADHGIDDIYFFARETQEDALNSVEGGTLDAALILEDVEGHRELKQHCTSQMAN